MRTIKILLTFGPASVPIDEVRRITNHSTGALGATLADYFRSQNHELIALRGEGATVPFAFPYLSFNTNHDLQKKLEEISTQTQPDLILHAAALCDYEIDRIQTEKSPNLASPSKISSHHPHLTLHLKPAPKILPQLRPWFPKSTIISWKYELEGTPAEAIAKAQKQVQLKYSDYSIINGKAYGPGFGICNTTAVIYPHLDSQTLAQKILTLI
ncbi:MAG: phosphopantothenoylcysteine decarboxylase [Verrucomicrobiota bacterium]